MSEISTTPLLLRARTGGLSLLALVLMLAGIGCLVVQTALLFGGELEDTKPLARFLPGALGLVFLVMFYLKGLRKGDIAVHLSGVTGRSKSGKRYALAWDAIGEIDLRGSMLILRDPAGKTLLVDSPPTDPAIRGLIWLRLNHDFGDAVWQAFAAPAALVATGATRQFLREDGDAAFLDMGIVLDMNGQAIYLPESDTVSIPKKIEGDQNLSTTLMPSGMVLKFDPNPALLPMQRLVAALQSAPMDGKLRGSSFLALVEKHGGAILSTETDGWTGETSGWNCLILAKEL